MTRSDVIHLIQRCLHPL